MGPGNRPDPIYIYNNNNNSNNNNNNSNSNSNNNDNIYHIHVQVKSPACLFGNLISTQGFNKSNSDDDFRLFYKTNQRITRSPQKIL